MPKTKGPLRLYNMFPRSFKNFDAMREYVGEVARMGFNAVWLNPLQEVGSVEIIRPQLARISIPIDSKVSGSLYAAKSDRLNQEFISYDEKDTPQEIQHKGEEQLKALIAEIKKHGMTPMFDLVANHVARDAEIAKLHPEWFMESEQFLDVVEFDYQKYGDEIVENYWRPRIKKYVEEYGFEAIRVDAVVMFSINKCPQVRKKLYKIFVEIAKDENPLIFEEWLFSGFNADNLVNDLLLDENYPSHVTTSLFYERLGFDLSKNYKSEVQTKERAVFVRSDQSLKFKHRGSVMNFSSIHDTESLMQSIFGEVIESQTDRYKTYQNISRRISEKISFLTKQDPKDSLKITSLKIIRSKVMFCATNHLFENPTKKDLKVFEYFAKEKIATMAFSGGGGFILTCGDESGDVKSRALFLPRSRKNRFLYSSFSREYNDFIGALVEIDDRVLDFCKDRIKAINNKNGVPDQEITLEDIDKFQRTLPRSNDLKSRMAFADLKSEVEKDLKRDKMLQNAANDELDRLEESYVNFGKGPLAGRLDLRKFITEINQILAQMPEGQFGHFSEVLHLPDKPELVIVARTNGRDFKIANDAPPRCQCDLIILNVDDVNSFTIDDEDLHKIYMEFERIVGAPYDGSYNHIAKANLYLGGQIVNHSSKKEVMSVGGKSFELPEYAEAVSAKAQSTKALALDSSNSKSPTLTFP